MFFDKNPAALFSFLALTTCASVPVNAADLPGGSESPAPDSSSTNWDGLYFGVQWGYGVGSTKWRDPRGSYGVIGDVSADGYNDGLLGGVQIGYNKQYGELVVGIEGDVNAGRRAGYASCGATAGVGGTGETCGNRSDVMASLTGRLGYAAGRSLFYVKGGGAYSRDRTTVSNYYYFPMPPASRTSNRYGWTVGAGVAYALDPNWSVNAEYGYYDFGKHTYSSGSGANAGSFSVAHVQQVAKFGLNYRLGGGGGSTVAFATSNDFSSELGTRVGYSSGRFQKRQYDGIERRQLNSVLTWPDQDGLALEAFARLDHRSGWFLKGTLGGVDIGSSKMYDEDTAAVMTPFPYSKTVSSTKNGRNLYGTVDLGYSFLREKNGNLGGFIGYGYYRQHLNGYGCEQVAGSVICVPAGLVNSSALILSETETWHALRLGFTGSAMLSDRLSLSGEVAWLPYASLSATDNHWFQPDINPMNERGHGSKSYQLESTLSYAVSRQWHIGAGLRYLYLQAKGSTHFPYPDYPGSPETFESSRLTAFLQASYRFGDGRSF